MLVKRGIICTQKNGGQRRIVDVHTLEKVGACMHAFIFSVQIPAVPSFNFFIDFF